MSGSLAQSAPLGKRAAVYKDASEVVEVAHGAGISRRVARMRPLAVVKG